MIATLIGGPISDPLKERTDVIYSLYMEKQKKKQKMNIEQNSANNANLGVGIALGVGALGFIMALKNKMF